MSLLEISLRQRVKEATRPTHEKLDSDPLALRLMTAQASREDYIQFLSRTLGFMEPIEQLLSSDAVARLATKTWKYGAKRSSLIEADLAAQGLSARQIGTIPRMSPLPQIRTLGHFMGVSYVIEGSMMGGLVMAKPVAKHLGLDRSQMTFFLPIDPKSIVNQFEQFVKAFDDFANCECDEREAMESAHETFELIHAWFNQGRTRVQEPRTH
jgi:heme oxygenase (biliverdin-IX-beta and delta-forming)